MSLNAADKVRFAIVLKNLKYDCLASFASTVRHYGHRSTGVIDVPATTRPVSCRYLSNINCGSYHVVIILSFADGTMWVLKVPGNGHNEGWDSYSADSLASEAQTMRLIRRETSIPIPEVHAFDGSVDNVLGCPYILMDMIQGRPLYEVWFDEDVSQNKLEEYRARALQGIAAAMSQLNRLNFGKGGALRFDDKGNLTGIGGSKAVDLEALYEKLQTEEKATPFYLKESSKDPKSYFQALLDRRAKKMERSEFDKGVYELLRLLIAWSLSDSSTLQDKPFVLSHPDFDSQNILVTNDGTLAGLIDWDWVSAVPSCIGCHKYPLFLTKDYDPVNYDYDLKNGKPFEGYDANSPAELSCYRAMYAQFIEACLTKDERADLDKDSRQAARVFKARKEASNMTRRSLVAEILELAASAPHLTTRILTNMVEEIERLTAAEWDANSSTTESVKGCESDNDEGEGIADTTISQMDSNSSLEDKVCTGEFQSGLGPKLSQTFSTDDLFNEIVALTTLSPSNGLDLGSAADQVCPYTTLAIQKEEGFTNPDGESSNSRMNTSNARQPRQARVCGWAKKKLRRRAEKLHCKDGPKDAKKQQQPKMDRACDWARKKLQRGTEHSRNEEKGEQAKGDPASRKPRMTRDLCAWTGKQLRRAFDTLHCNEEQFGEEEIKSKVDITRKGDWEELVEWLHKELKQLLQTLRIETEADVSNVTSSSNQVGQNLPTLDLAADITKDKKREICNQVALMAQNSEIPLTFEHQVAVARWMIQTLQGGPYSNMASERVKANRLPTDGDADSSDEMCDINSGGIPGKERSARAETREQVATAIGRESPMLKISEVEARLSLEGTGGDRHQGGVGGKEEDHDHGDVLVNTSSQETENLEKVGEGAAANSDETRQSTNLEDDGSFFMPCICIALAKGNLDERRMQRLKDGFFALLNQTS